MIAALFLLGPVVVVPLGLRLVPEPGGQTARAALLAARLASIPAGLVLVVAYLRPSGVLAAALAVPWLAVALLAAGAALADALDALHVGRAWRPGVRHGTWFALGALSVAAGNAVADRLGVRPFDFAPIIVLLTAVHFTFAGFALVLVGTLAHAARPARPTAMAVGTVIVGIPVTAVGFLGVAIAALIGAVLVAAGGLGIGVALLRESRPADRRSTAARWCTRLAGASLLVSMPLAIAYAVGTFAHSAWLDLPTMARTHGAINVLGFALPAMVALALDRRAGSSLHDGPARPTDVLGFNIAPVVLAPAAGALGMLAALTPQPLPLRIALAVGGLIAIILTTTAITSPWWVFERSSARRWDWVVRQAGEPRRWLNLTTGFDDSTSTLRRSLSGQGRSIDVVDPALALDHPLRRARRRFPPPGSPVDPVMLDGAVEPRSVDVVFLLMAAHEAHGPARSALLRSAARAIGPGGRLILVEHPRDAANIVAFGPGAWHFSRREAWIETTTEAGLRVVDETKLSPFVRGFVLASATER